jgi:hypothetical protein
VLAVPAGRLTIEPSLAVALELEAHTAQCDWLEFYPPWSFAQLLFAEVTARECRSRSEVAAMLELVESWFAKPGAIFRVVDGRS